MRQSAQISICVVFRWFTFIQTRILIIWRLWMQWEHSLKSQKRQMSSFKKLSNLQNSHWHKCLVRMLATSAHTFWRQSLMKMIYVIWKESHNCIQFPEPSIKIDITITDFVKTWIFARRAPLLPKLQESASHHVEFTVKSYALSECL